MSSDFYPRFLLRCGLAGSVGPIAFATYQAIRDRIWRDSHSGARELRAAWKDGRLAASGRSSFFADAIGTSPRLVQRAIKDLEAAHWIRVEGSRKSPTGQIFVLGTREENREHFFVDDLQNNTAETPKRCTTSSKIDQVNDIYLVDFRLSTMSKIDQVLSRKSTKPHTKQESKEGIERKNRVPWSKLCCTESLTEIEIELNADHFSDDRVVRPYPPTPRPAARSVAVESTTEVSKNDTSKPNGALVDMGDGWKICPDEIAIWASAKAKSDRPAECSFDELVVFWKRGFFRTFEANDPTLTTKAARQRCARLCLQRLGGWFEGDRGLLFDYVRWIPKWWTAEEQRKRKFPSGAPSLFKLLEQKRDCTNHFYGVWMTERRPKMKT